MPGGPGHPAAQAGLLPRPPDASPEGRAPVAAAETIGQMPQAVLGQRLDQLEELRARRGGLAVAISGAAAQAPDGADQPDGRPAKRRAPGGGVHPVVNTARLNVGRCAECGKTRYPSRAAARKAARMVSPGRRLRLYQCGDYWHMTSIRGRD